MHLVSISVWGDHAMYWEGAIRNSELCPQIYPGWKLRVYTDTTNQHTQILQQNGAEVVIMPNRGGIHGMFWRFLPASEPGIEAMIVRDADSRLNVREAVAVEAWLRSGKTHVKDLLITYRRPFDGFHETHVSASKCCLARFDRNRYSVDATAAKPRWPSRGCPGVKALLMFHKWNI